MYVLLFLFFFFSFRSVQPGCKIPSSPYSIQNNSASNLPNGIVQNGSIPTKHSMLDKLKLFNKDKTDRSSKTQVSKRTSSSSGFSSARSERSDSSLSLNEGPTTVNVGGKLFANSKKVDIINSSSKTKTKMLSTSKNLAKESATSNNLKSKPEKKEKSPARIEPVNNEAKLITPAKSKIEVKPKPPSGSIKKLDVRSESKNNLSQIQQPKTFVPAVTGVTGATGATGATSIPKPMAFIKGTTKQTMQLKSEQQNTKLDKPVDISNINISPSHYDQKYIISQPLNVHENTVQLNQSSSAMHQLPSMQQQIINQSISMSDSSNSKSTHSSSTGVQSNSSDSSVIYRPSSESGSEAFYMKENIHRNNSHQLHNNKAPMCIPSNKKLDAYTEQILITENGHKFNTVPSKMLHGTIFEEEKQMTIIPMRPLLRGYSSHVTLPTRGTRGQHLVSEYCEDIGQGYCSDGDALRKVPVRCSDIENGYMSEGGGPQSNCMNGKHHMIGIMRTRTQLPTTFEER